MQEEEVRRCFAMVTWRLDYQLWQEEEEEELRKDFNVAWMQTLRINSCTFEQFKDIQEMMLLILHCKTMYFTERIYRVHLPRREREWIEFNSRKWIDSREKKPQKRKTSCVLHNSERDGRWKLYGGNSMRLYIAKDCSMQKYLETSSEYGVLVQTWKLAQ